MPYLALPRKYRPQNFQQIVGQDYTVRALQNAISKDRLHHAYLLTGTRGVGKTSLARIFAKSLNCTDLKDGEPCDACPNCKAISAVQFADVLEIDAASRTKVEDTRELLNNVQYAPVHGNYKVYIIDEVHMLSGHSFNALLKTLEEPPPHVIFILATTDPQRLPITVLSRCLQFHLKQLSPECIKNYLAKIMDLEQISADDLALTLIAEAADGSMRDALSLLDQALMGSETQLADTTVREMLGSVAPVKLQTLLQHIQQNAAQAAIDWTTDSANNGIDFFTLTDDLLQFLHTAAIAQTVPDSIPKTQANYSAIYAIANSLSPEELQLYYEIVLLNKKNLPYAASPRQGFEMMVLRLLAFCPQKKTASAKASPTKKKNP